MTGATVRAQSGGRVALYPLSMIVFSVTGTNHAAPIPDVSAVFDDPGLVKAHDHSNVSPSTSDVGHSQEVLSAPGLVEDTSSVGGSSPRMLPQYHHEMAPYIPTKRRGHGQVNRPKPIPLQHVFGMKM